MPPLETFFTFSFVSVFAAAMLATCWRYLPRMIAFYRTIVSDRQRTLAKYIND